MPITSGDDIRTLFDAETITVVGCSATADKPAHDIPACVRRHGYRVTPVNPFHDEILGEMTYDSLADMNEDADLVDIFRPFEGVGNIADAAIECATDHGSVEAVWFQLGVRDDDTAACAEEAGLLFVQDKCFKVKHSRLV